MSATQTVLFHGTGDPIFPFTADFVLLTLVAKTFSAARQLSYAILSENGKQWESGRGALIVGGGLSRVTVSQSSTGGKVNFDHGRHIVYAQWV